VEVWQTSNLRPLRLGEEKRKKKNKRQDENISWPVVLHRAAIKEERKNKPQGKSIMSASATQGGHKKKEPQDEKIMVCPIP